MYFLDFNENVVFWPKWWIFWHKTWLWGICTSYACGQRHLVTVPMRYGSIRYDSYEKCTNFGSILIISVDHYYGDFGHVSPPHTAIFGRFRGIKYLDQHIGGYYRNIWKRPVVICVSMASRTTRDTIRGVLAMYFWFFRSIPMPFWGHRWFELQKRSILGQKWPIFGRKWPKMAKFTILKCKYDGIPRVSQVLMLMVGPYAVVFDG